MTVSGSPKMARKFEHAITREAITFAQKVLILADPEVQEQHERGLAEIREGKGIPFSDLVKQLGLRPQ